MDFMEKKEHQIIKKNKNMIMKNNTKKNNTKKVKIDTNKIQVLLHNYRSSCTAEIICI